MQARGNTKLLIVVNDWNGNLKVSMGGTNSGLRILKRKLQIYLPCVIVLVFLNRDYLLNL